MKSILLLTLLLASPLTIASTIYPRLTVWPHSAEVSVWNNTDKDAVCSGSIFIYTYSNRFRTEFFHRVVRSYSQQFQSFVNYNMNDPFRNAHHSIFCREL